MTKSFEEKLKAKKKEYVDRFGEEDSVSKLFDLVAQWSHEITIKELSSAEGFRGWKLKRVGEKVEASYGNFAFFIGENETVQVIELAGLMKANAKILLLESKLKEHEDKGLVVYGRKIEVLSNTIKELEKENEDLMSQSNIRMSRALELEQENKVITNKLARARALFEVNYCHEGKAGASEGHMDNYDNILDSVQAETLSTLTKSKGDV